MQTNGRSADAIDTFAPPPKKRARVPPVFSSIIQTSKAHAGCERQTDEWTMLSRILNVFFSALKPTKVSTEADVLAHVVASPGLYHW